MRWRVQPSTGGLQTRDGRVRRVSSVSKHTTSRFVRQSVLVGPMAPEFAGESVCGRDTTTKKGVGHGPVSLACPDPPTETDPGGSSLDCHGSPVEEEHGLGSSLGTASFVTARNCRTAETPWANGMAPPLPSALCRDGILHLYFSPASGPQRHEKQVAEPVLSPAQVGGRPDCGAAPSCHGTPGRPSRCRTGHLTQSVKAMPLAFGSSAGGRASRWLLETPSRANCPWSGILSAPLRVSGAVRRLGSLGSQ